MFKVVKTKFNIQRRKKYDSYEQTITKKPDLRRRKTKYVIKNAKRQNR